MAVSTQRIQPPSKMTRRVFAVLGCATALVVTGCGSEETSSDADAGAPLNVVAGFYPIAEAATAIGGDRAAVTNLTPPGGGPHDLELKPGQIAAIEDSGLVLYIGNGFQPQIEKAVQSLPASVQQNDLLEGAQTREAQVGIPGVRGEVDGEVLEGNVDPHVWVDPAGFAAMAERIRDAMIAADPSSKRTFEANAKRYIDGLNTLDTEFSTSLDDCRSKVLVTSHAAFGYLTDRYKLTQAPIAGISPEAEPDPKSLAATAKYAKANGVKTVFFETLVPRKLSQTVARTIGAETDALDPVEGLTQKQLDSGESYSSIQRENLAALVKGLRCTAS